MDSESCCPVVSVCPPCGIDDGAGGWTEIAGSRRTQQLRRQAEGETDTLLADNDRMQSETERLQNANQGIEREISRLQEQLAERKRQLAERPVEWPEWAATTEAEPEAVTAGVEFSILGLATEAKSFIIVIDMSGSMINYADLMLRSIVDILP